MSLNQVLQILKGYFDSHPQVADVSLSLSDSDFNAISNFTYPIVDIQYIDTDVVEKRFQNNFKIILADLTNPNVEGIDFEIYSDRLQVAGDFFQWAEESYDLDIIRTTSLQPFQDSNVDRISGVVFNIGVYSWINQNISC